MKYSAYSKGFSLIELMIVVAILAVLAGFAYPSYMNYVQRSRLENARATMSDIIQSMERHYAENNTFCATRAGTTVDINDRSKDNCAAVPDFPQTNQYYDFAVTAQPSGYTLIATPKSGVYESSVLASKPLIIQYNSTASAFSRCTTEGINNAKDLKAETVAGCEVM